jgi:hypothetical protein
MLPTLLDIAKSRGSDGLVGLVEEVLPALTELRLAPARGIRGINYKQNVRTGLPAGSFRNANEGVTATKSTFEERLFQCFIANALWQCDKAVADAHEDGAPAYIAAEGVGLTAGQLAHVCKQFYYGTSNDAKGFPGLLAMYNTAMSVDAGGTTADTASSVWAVKWGPMGVQLLLGNDAQLTLSDVKEIVANDANSKPFTAYHQEFLAWMGLKLSSLNAVARIKKLTADNGKGLTDALLGKCLALFPVGYKPDVFLASRRSIEQLRASRTATNATGAEAPTPTMFEGIPIEATDSLVNTEALTL